MIKKKQIIVLQNKINVDKNKALTNKQKTNAITKLVLNRRKKQIVFFLCF